MAGPPETLSPIHRLNFEGDYHSAPCRSRHQVVPTTRAYRSPNDQLVPFLERPEARGNHCVGRSVTRQPRFMHVRSSSAVWDPPFPESVGDVGQHEDAERPCSHSTCQ